MSGYAPGSIKHQNHVEQVFLFYFIYSFFSIRPRRFTKHKRQERIAGLSRLEKEKKIFFSRGPIEGTVEIHFFSSERRRFSSTFKSGGLSLDEIV